MTTNARRASILERALRSWVLAEPEAADLFTEDLTAWTPTFSAASRSELFAERSRLGLAFSDTELSLHPLDVGHDRAAAEWRLSLTHSGGLSVGKAWIQPTGMRVTLVGVTVAEFRGDQICSIRHYWDELMLLEQLGGSSEREVGDRELH